MNEDRYFDRQRERAESEAEARAERVESYAQDLMQRGKSCYPWSALGISEALHQASFSDFVALQAAAEEHDWAEFGALMRAVILNYWESQAMAVAEKSPQVDAMEDGDG